MSASGVVSIALAKTGFVILCTIPSEMLPPSSNDLIEMLKNYLAASRRKRGVQLYSKFDYVETVRVQPRLALCLSLHRMHVHRSLPSFEEKWTLLSGTGKLKGALSQILLRRP